MGALAPFSSRWVPLPDHARVLEMRLAGDTVTQIADALGLTRQSVYRMLDLIQSRLRMLNEGTRP